MLAHLSALKKAKLGQLAQLGLRLVNGLHGTVPSNEFWQTYLKYVTSDNIFTKLSPHSKCLLTCVLTKLNTTLPHTPGTKAAVEKIIQSVTTYNTLSRLNLELLNMLFVAICEMRVKPDASQLRLLLRACEENLKDDDIFINQHISSVIFSLGTVAKIFPDFKTAITESPMIRKICRSPSIFFNGINNRELSVFIHAMSRLGLSDDVVVSEIVAELKKRSEHLHGLELATILYASSIDSKMAPIFTFLKPMAIEKINQMTPREIGNVACAFIRSKSWNPKLDYPLAKAAMNMNIQELCNVINMFQHHKITLSTSVKNALAAAIENMDAKSVSLLDCLTIANALYAWKINKGKTITSLERLINNLLSSGEIKFGEKLVYLCYYCWQLDKSTLPLDPLLHLVSQRFDSTKLTPKELVIIYNCVSQINGYEKLKGDLEETIKSQMAMNTPFSWIDAKTLIQVGNGTFAYKIKCEYVPHVDHKVPESLQLLELMLRNHNDDIARQAGTRVISQALEDQSTDLESLSLLCAMLPNLKTEMKAAEIAENIVEQTCSILQRKRLNKGNKITDSLYRILSACKMLNVKSPNVETIALELLCRLHMPKDTKVLHKVLHAIFWLDLKVTIPSKYFEYLSKIIKDDLQSSNILYLICSLAFLGYRIPRAILERPLTLVFSSAQSRIPTIDKALYTTIGGIQSLECLHAASQYIELDAQPIQCKPNEIGPPNKMQASIYNAISHINSTIHFELSPIFDYKIDILMVPN